MRYLFLLAFLVGCVNYDGLEERNRVTPINDSAPGQTDEPGPSTPDSDPIVDLPCSVHAVGTIQGCKVDIPAPGVTDDFYLYIGGYTDGIMGGDKQHPKWYRIGGQDTIVFIGCGQAWEGKGISVSYGCIP